MKSEKMDRTSECRKKIFRQKKQDWSLKMKFEGFSKKNSNLRKFKFDQNFSKQSFLFH